VSNLLGQVIEKTSVLCPMEHINNVYELPSIEQAVRYLHAAAGHPTKYTWLKAIARGNYNLWPLITVRNVRKNFPELEETQLGHMGEQGKGYAAPDNHQGSAPWGKTESHHP
jgi:hypothetical protein